MNKKANNLINESSTYLLQHAYNPVNWFPWTEEALKLSVKQDKPILLSIGYSACHWCHVMEEESFEDEETASLLNENFIPIKVDREERPELDDIYMNAVQLMTGHGGWPLTVFLTPQLKPFYGGTYFPKEDRHYGQSILPGFKTVLKAIEHAWQTQRNEIEASADDITSAINSAVYKTNELNQSKSIEEHQSIFARALDNLAQIFDPHWGGFGNAPKFPQALALLLCLRGAIKYNREDKSRSSRFLKIVGESLDKMYCGGIYDHLGGGFARYSTDEKWRIPHFEKMLYDNALLAEVYFKAFATTGKENWRLIASETLDFMSRELSSPEGAFYSSLDADSEGSEGKYYTWTKQEVEEILGSDSHLFCQVFNITESGNFEHQRNVLYLNSDRIPDKIIELKKLLFMHREKRVHPGRDEKILTSWNGLAISSFVSGYQATGEESYLTQAKLAANFILENMLINNRLQRSYAQGRAKLFGYLDDYAFFIQALIDLASVDEHPKWLSYSLRLTDLALLYFFDQNEKDLFYTAKDHQDLIARPKNYHDGPIPSAASVMLANLLKLSLINNNEQCRQYVDDILAKHSPKFTQFSLPYANMINVWDSAYTHPSNLVLVTSKDEIRNKEMLLALHRPYSPDRVILLKDGIEEDKDGPFIFKDKKLIAEQTTVYACQGYECKAPMNNINQLKQTLNSPYLTI